MDKKNNLDLRILKKFFLNSFQKTLENSKPIIYLKKNIKKKNKNIIKILDDEIDLRKGKLFLIGWGKISGYLAKYLVEIIGKKSVNKGLIITNNRVAVSDNIKVLQGTHPFPSSKTFRSSKKLLKFIKKIKPNDYVISLISGGGSSMLCIPSSNISLNEKKELTKQLLIRGIQPKKINTIRKFMSKVKGGKLLKNINSKKVFNLLVSDENQNLMHSIASGPTIIQKWDFRKVFNDLADKKIKRLVSKKLLNKIKDSAKKSKKEQSLSKIYEKVYFQSRNKNINNLILYQRNLIQNKIIKSKIIFDNHQFRNNFKNNIIKNSNINVLLYKDFLFGNYNINKKKIISTIEQSKKNKQIIIFGSQIEIDIGEKNSLESSKGGRLQHLCLDIASKLRKKKYKNFIVSGFASDGEDFLKNISGVVISSESLLNFSQREVNNYLRKYRSFYINKLTNSLIYKEKNTENNIMDIIVIYFSKHR